MMLTCTCIQAALRAHVLFGEWTCRAKKHSRRHREDEFKSKSDPSQEASQKAESHKKLDGVSDVGELPMNFADLQDCHGKLSPFRVIRIIDREIEKWNGMTAINFLEENFSVVSSAGKSRVFGWISTALMQQYLEGYA